MYNIFYIYTYKYKTVKHACFSLSERLRKKPKQAKFV